MFFHASKLDLGLGSVLYHGKSKNVRLRKSKLEKARRPVSAFHPLVAEQSITTTNTKKNDPDFWQKKKVFTEENTVTQIKSK